MNRTALVGLVLLANALGLPVSGWALEFNALQADASRLEFTYKQMNVSMHGRFRQFAAQLRFDPANVGNATVSLDVDLASIDTGAAEGDAAVAGKEWFNTRAYPRASFVSGSIRPLVDNRFEVAGELSIKGHTQRVTVPITVTVKGASATVDGTFIIKRADFFIGEGPWSDIGVIANEIQVVLHIVASAK
jgi:polyisoprenoid-binding protein YceI